VRNGDCIFYAENGSKVVKYTYQNGKSIATTYLDKQGNATQEHFELYTQKADELFDKKKYTEALDWYVKAKNAAADQCGKNSSYYAEKCDDYAYCLSKTEKNVQKLIEVHKEPVQIYESLGLQKIKKYANACYNLAFMYNEYKDFESAEKYYAISQNIFEEIKKTEEKTYYNTLISLFSIYHNRGMYDKAEPCCKKIMEIKKQNNEAETGSYAHYLYKYAFYQKRKGNYADVEKMMNEVITINAKVLEKTTNEKKSPNVVSGVPQKVKKTNLGANINTKYGEILPIISADGKTLYFDRKYAPENTNGDKDPDEIYFSTLQADGTWSKAQNIGKPLNNLNSNAVISVTPDNNMLIVIGQYNEDGSQVIEDGISFSYRTDKGWSIPQKITIKKLTNASKYVHYSLSSDSKTLLCSIEGENTIGKRDVYVSFLQEDGTWSEPKNLGKQVNTKYDEESPFLASDGVTLYYSTAGLPGYGGKDIFVTKRLDDTWTNWSEPENLGHEMNSDGDDAFFVIPASGKYAYMSSTFESTNGSNDIIQIELPEVLKPKAVVLVQGKVIDSKTKKPLGAKITYRDLKTDALLGIANSSPLDGSYQIVLPSGNIYSFLAEKNGYIATSNNLNLEKLSAYKEIEQNLLLTPIEAGQTVRLNNIFFDTDKYDLKPESTSELSRLIRILNQNTSLTIEISGHTDASGNDQHNIQLSQNRADAVKNYLLSKGISADRLTSKGYGKSKPVASNDTEEGRQQNRRVEFTIVK
jgi:outer membrane protein OmpA-like peptidoglycan-associated protein/tetratricopeptide (TPR) repeat protein